MSITKCNRCFLHYEYKSPRFPQMIGRAGGFVRLQTRPSYPQSCYNPQYHEVFPCPENTWHNYGTFFWVDKILDITIEWYIPCKNRANSFENTWHNYGMIRGQPWNHDKIVAPWHSCHAFLATTKSKRDKKKKAKRKLSSLKVHYRQISKKLTQYCCSDRSPCYIIVWKQKTFNVFTAL